MTGACLRDPSRCPLRSGIYCTIAGDDAAVRCSKLQPTCEHDPAVCRLRHDGDWCLIRDDGVCVTRPRPLKTMADVCREMGRALGEQVNAVIIRALSEEAKLGDGKGDADADKKDA